MKHYQMWIGGKWVDADYGKTFPVFNPATEEIIAELPMAVRRMWIKQSRPRARLSRYGPENRKRNVPKSR